MSYSLSDTEIKVLEELSEGKEFDKIEGNRDAIINAARRLHERKLIILEKSAEPVILLTNKGKEAVEKGLPELRLFEFIKREGKIGGDLTNEEINAALGVLFKNNLIKREGDKFLAIGKEDILKEKQKKLEELGLGIKNEYLDEFLKRGLIEIKEKEVYKAKITDEGRNALKALSTKLVANLNREIIKNYQNYQFRAYDLNNIIPISENGRNLVKDFIDEIREIMVSLGFQEMQSNYVEEVFWNYDVMMFRQNHPDRDIQDTIYLDEYGQLDKDLLEKVKDTYLHGIKGISLGYGGSFDEKESARLILRGHTTATTFRYLYYVISKNKDANYRFFSVDRVFRNETLDATHLKEFHQIEGMIYEDGLSARSLIGYIKEFYKRLGIEKIRVKPTYNPYTEPSFEIQGFSDKLNKWIEIGNSGMFRIETLYPLGITKNVAGFGLALGRALMLKYNIPDIRLINGSESDLSLVRGYKSYLLW